MTAMDIARANMMARTGIGWEDICNQLKINSEHGREKVRRIVLDRQQQMEIAAQSQPP